MFKQFSSSEFKQKKSILSAGYNKQYLAIYKIWKPFIFKKGKNKGDHLKLLNDVWKKTEKYFKSNKPRQTNWKTIGRAQLKLGFGNQEEYEDLQWNFIKFIHMLETSKCIIALCPNSEEKKNLKMCFDDYMAPFSEIITRNPWKELGRKTMSQKIGVQPVSDILGYLFNKKPYLFWAEKTIKKLQTA